jgi:hypothetical protein
MKMNKNTQKGKTPLEARQERLQRLREIYEANKDKCTKEQIEQIMFDYLLSQGLSFRTIRKEYLEPLLSAIVT